MGVHLHQQTVDCKLKMVMTAQLSATFFCYLALFILKDITPLTSAAPASAIYNRPSLVLGDCTGDNVVANPTEGNPLYSHSELFGANATLNDVEAFKYYCINDL